MKFPSPLFLLPAVAAASVHRRTAEEIAEIRATIPEGHIHISKSVEFKAGEQVDLTMGQVISPDAADRPQRALRGGGSSGSSDFGFLGMEMDDDDAVIQLISGSFEYMNMAQDDDIDYNAICNRDFDFKSYGNAEEVYYKIGRESAEKITTCAGELNASIRAPINKETGCTEVLFGLQMEDSNDDVEFYCDTLSVPYAKGISCVRFNAVNAIPATTTCDANTDISIAFDDTSISIGTGSTAKTALIFKVGCCPYVNLEELLLSEGLEGKESSSKE